MLTECAVRKVQSYERSDASPVVLHHPFSQGYSLRGSGFRLGFGTSFTLVKGVSNNLFENFRIPENPRIPQFSDASPGAPFLLSRSEVVYVTYVNVFEQHLDSVLTLYV